MLSVMLAARGSAGASATKSRVAQKAMAIPAAQPAAARTLLSMRSCRTMPARDAPRLARMASSRLRASARASSRPAMLMQAMSSTAATAAKRIQRRFVTLYTVASCKRSTFAPRRASSRFAITPIAACASSSETPSFRRATTEMLRAVRTSRYGAIAIAIGNQTSTLVREIDADAGITPMTRYDSPSSVIAKLSMARRPKRRVHNASLMTATRSWSSAAMKPRPASAFTPRTLK